MIIVDFFYRVIDRVFNNNLLGARSSSWSKVRKEFLLSNPKCSVCNRKKKLEVHHIIPFHIKPELELDPENLITLCREHHILFGHLMDFKKYNNDVLKDVEYFNNKINV